jgi:DNA-binding SARP family transcriptional activator/tetratricopeptide (TPR) repeat protein
MFLLRTLGELRLSSPSGELLPGRRKELVLLAYLARRSPRAVRRAELAALLWGERDEARARHSLRQALLALRRAVGEGLVITAGNATLSAGVVETDLATFEAAVAAGRLDEAAASWGGDFLTDADEVGGESCRAWVAAERERARRCLSGMFERLVVGTATDRPAAVAWAERWAEQLPLDERAHLRMVEVLFLDGQIEAARARHAEFGARVRAELGAEPTAAFSRLGERLRDAETPAAALLKSAGSAALFTPDPVGQDAALAELRAAWRAAAASGAVVVVVEGGEGMGKTLLCEEFLRSLEDHAEPALILRGAARDERAAAWSAARDLLLALAGAPGLGGASDRALAELSRLLPEIRQRWPHLPEPRGDESALHQATGQVLEAVAAELPVAMFLDDFPASDAATRRLIVALARRPSRGVLLLLSARPDGIEAADVLAELCHAPGTRRLKLAPLAVERIETLLGSMLELAAAERRSLAARLHAETGGNPFYAMEIVSAMVDEGQLAPDARGIWRTRTALGDDPLPLPTSVRDAIGRRLARTSADAHRLGAAAAVLGGPVDPALLRAVAGLSSVAFEAALAELTARHLLRHATSRAGEWEFAHPLIRRVAYDALPAAEREALHRAAAAAVGARSQRDATVRAALVYHQDRAGIAGRRSLLRGRVRRTAATGFAAAGLVLAGILAVTAMLERRNQPTTVPTLAVGQLAGHGGTNGTGDAAAAGDMLATNLARVAGLQVVSSARLYEILGRDSAQHRASITRAARHAGAGELLEGALHRSPAGGLRLDLRRVELRTGTVRAGYTFEGADVFELIDRATAEIAADLGLPSGRLRVAEVATPSLVAYRFYEEGLRSNAVADYRGAVRLFEAALAEDSTFAMAYHYLWAAREALHQPIPDTARARMLRLADRAADRERLLMRATWAVTLDWSQRIAVAETLAIRYPAEPDGHLLLGSHRLSAGDFLGALPQLQRVVRMDSLGLLGAHPRCRACDAYAHVIGAYAHADSLAAAERVVREWLRRQPRSARAWSSLAVTLSARGRYDEALDARRTAAALNPVDYYDALFPATMRILTGDFATADLLLRELARDGTPEVQREALWFLTISLRHQGRLREALATIRESPRDTGAAGMAPALQHEAQVLFEMGRFADAARLFSSVARLSLVPRSEALDARHKSWNLTHLSTALAAAGDTGRLAALADTIEAWGRRSAYGRDWRLHHHVRGLLLAELGQGELAAAAFRRAMYSTTHGYTRTNLELARVLLELGRPREAVPVLQPAFRGPTEASNLYVTRTELHTLLGRAWEAAGEPDSAATHYRQVLHAWRDADSALHTRRDSVRTRLHSLGRPDT